jgi:tetratricopeptide (TPR) repeat protein
MRHPDKGPPLVKKKANFKFLACLLAGAAVTGIGVHFLHAVQVKRNAGALLRHANQAETEGNLPRAAHYLVQYLALVPDDTETRIQYGLLLADKRMLTSPRATMRAFLFLDDVSRRVPERQGIRRRVVQLAIDVRRFTDARGHLEHLLQENPQDGELERLLGQCQEEARDYQQARMSYEGAIRHAPDVTETYNRLAYLLRRHAGEVLQGKEKKSEVLRLADQRIEEMVAANERSFRAYLARARYYREFCTAEPVAAALPMVGGGAVALGASPLGTAPFSAVAALVAGKAASPLAVVERDVNRALELAPEEADVLLAVAELAQSQTADAARGQADSPQTRAFRQRARDYLQRGCGLHPNDWRLYQALARLEVQEGQPEAALARLQEGLRRTPCQIDLLWDLANLLIRQKHREEAGDCIARLEKVHFPSAALDFLNASLLGKHENWKDAVGLLERSYPLLLGYSNQGQDAFFTRIARQAGLLLCHCYEQLGNADRAQEAYNRLVAQDPRSIDARLGLAATYWTMGQLTEAQEQYEHILRLPDAPAGTWINLAQLLIARNLTSDSPDWAGVDQALLQVERLEPRPSQALILRAEYLIAQKRYKEAHALLENEAGQTKPRAAEIWAALSELRDREGDTEGAQAVLDEAEQEVGDHIELRLARASFWGRHTGAAAETGLAELIKDLGKFSPKDEDRLLRQAATAYLQIGESQKSEQVWTRLAERRPKLVDVKLVLFDFSLHAGNEEAMQRLIEEIRNLEGDEGCLWRYCQACRRIGQASKGNKERLTEARAVLSAVARRRPHWSRVALCRAHIEELLGDRDAALMNYRRAIQLGERGTFATRRAVELLYQRGRFEEAYQLLRTMPEPALSSGHLPRVATEVALRVQDKARAAGYAQKAVTNQSKDYHDYIWLSRTLWAAGDLKNAESALHRARALEERVPETWVALVLYFAATKQKDKAEDVLKAAEVKLAGIAAALDLAPCHEALGHVERAKELYRAALAAKPEDLATLRAVADFYVRTGQFRDAQTILRRLADTYKSEAPEIAAWAQQSLAVVLAIGGNYQQSREAPALLSPAKEASPQTDIAATVDAQRARARVLALQRSRGERRQAIQILERLVEQREASSDDVFLLAQLYEAVDNWPKARRRLLGLLAERQQDPVFLIHYAGSMLRHDEVQEADIAVRELEKLEPNGFPTKAVHAQILMAKGRRDAAVAMLEEYAAQNKALNIGALAALLEHLGAHSAAEKMYRTYVDESKEAEAVLLLVQFLGRRGRFREALDLCDRAWQTCLPEAVAQAWVVVVSEVPSDRGQFSRLERRLLEAIQKAPKSVGLHAALGVVHRLQGRYDEAEAVYRRILELNPRDVPALNNLAWLLAFKGKATEALGLVQQAYEIGGPDPGLLDTLAVAHLTMGRGDLALKDLEEAIAERPSPDMYFHLARAYQMTGKRKAAAEALRRASDGGLKETDLHLLERTAYHQLLRDLSPK